MIYLKAKPSEVETLYLHVSEVATGFEPVYTALQAVASPLGHATVRENQSEPGGLSTSHSERMTRFELATLTLAR